MKTFFIQLAAIAAILVTSVFADICFDFSNTCIGVDPNDCFPGSAHSFVGRTEGAFPVQTFRSGKVKSISITKARSPQLSGSVTSTGVLTLNLSSGPLSEYIVALHGKDERSQQEKAFWFKMKSNSSCQNMGDRSLYAIFEVEVYT